MATRKGSPPQVLLLVEDMSVALSTKWILEERGVSVAATDTLPGALKFLEDGGGQCRLALVSATLRVSKAAEACKALKEAARIEIIGLGEDAEGVSSCISCPPSNDEVHELLARYGLDHKECPGSPRPVNAYRKELLLGKRVLVIDQENVLCGALHKILTHECLEVETIDSMEEGLTAVQTEKFDACVIPWDADTSDFLNMVTTLGIQTPCITLCIRRENCPMQECHNSSLSSLVPYPVRLWDIMEATVKALVPEMVDDSEVDDIYQVPPVNFDLQLRNFDGDWPFVLELYQMFLLEGTEKMSRFVAAVQTWDIKELKSVSHSMKGCSYSAGLTRLGDIFTLLDRQLKDCEAKMNPSTSHGVDVWKQTMQLLTDMAMQEFLHCAEFHRDIQVLETIDFAASLDIFDGSYSKLSAKLNRTLEQAWPLAEAGDPLPLALHVASQTFLQTAAPELYAAATEVSKDPTSESAVEALEAEIIGFLEDASFLLGSVNLPTCCAPEGLQANA